jgi:uncharacterized protein (TIGR00269 family)
MSHCLLSDQKAPVVRCGICKKLKSGVKLKSYNLRVCFDCFIVFFERRIQKTIKTYKMFKKDERILVAVSGGKDSVALAKALKDLGYSITLYHVNCGIEEENYSSTCQRKVELLAQQEDLPLKIFYLKDEIPVEIKLAAKLFRKETCSVCGMIKRYLLNKVAEAFDVVCTGHNLNDEAASLLSSLIFWQEYMKRQSPVLEERGSLKRRVKPLSLTFEYETKLFCDLLKLPYHASSCPLVGGPYLFFKRIIEEIENEMPSSILNFYKGFLKRKKLLGLEEKETKLHSCERCGYLTVAKVCNFCKLKEKISYYLTRCPS